MIDAPEQRPGVSGTPKKEEKETSRSKIRSQDEGRTPHETTKRPPISLADRDFPKQPNLKLHSVIQVCPIGCETATTTLQPGEFASDTAEVKPTVTHRYRANLILTPPIYLPVTQLELCWNCGYPAMTGPGAFERDDFSALNVRRSELCRRNVAANRNQLTTSKRLAVTLLPPQLREDFEASEFNVTFFISPRMEVPGSKV
ncbi:hypothetical protein HHI36_010884 [Cryptolaemus montrouzieri]|uniref:Uncharacterized protein n=1 Tax=Cryptolaemus montrouzieri TaxID=559131 RepID=A0ABD2MK46_9CUCU